MWRLEGVEDLALRAVDALMPLLLAGNLVVNCEVTSARTLAMFF
jgi:hypothetical protein